MELLLRDKNVFLTGVGANIGRHIALEMASQGASIYFVDVSETACRSLQKELDELKVPSRGWILNLAQPETIGQLQRDFADAEIQIDILVNNAGASVEALLKHAANQRNETICDVNSQVANSLSSFEMWRLMLDINITGPMVLTEWISQTMIAAKREGCILFLSSIHQWTHAEDAMYSSAKAAVGAMINEFALKLAPHNIRVNGIAPGHTKIDENGAPISHAATPLYGTSIPPQQIARAAVYLASDYFSRYTTGTVLKIDAGLSLVNFVSKSASPAPRHWLVQAARSYRHKRRNHK